MNTILLWWSVVDEINGRVENGSLPCTCGGPHSIGGRLFHAASCKCWEAYDEAYLLILDRMQEHEG